VAALAAPSNWESRLKRDLLIYHSFFVYPAILEDIEKMVCGERTPHIPFFRILFIFKMEMAIIKNSPC